MLCSRRGPAIDLVLDRPKQDRSQFVFTQSRGRSMIFWQTRTVAMKANPGGRVPQRRALVAGFTIHVDTREKYAFRFAGRDVKLEHTAVGAGDYGVRNGDRWLAVVERKSIEDLMSSLSNGTLVYQMAAMAELPLAAVVVEGRYPKLFEARFVKDGWLPDILARLQIRYREIPIVFADSRKFAEEWTYRFLATALADIGESTDAYQVDQNGMSSASAESHRSVSTASTARRSAAAASAKRSSSRLDSAISRRATASLSMTPAAYARIRGSSCRASDSIMCR